MSTHANHIGTTARGNRRTVESVAVSAALAQQLLRLSDRWPKQGCAGFPDVRLPGRRSGGITRPNANSADPGRPIDMTQERFRRVFLLALVVAISVAFIAMIWSFLVTLMMAAIFAGIAHPLYRRLERRLPGGRVVASFCTILLLLVMVFVPLLGLAGALAKEAAAISDNVPPWVESVLSEPTRIDALLARIPFVEDTETIRAEIVRRSSELVDRVSTFLFQSLSAMTRGTIVFFFHFFILLYAMFFFFIDGRRMAETTLAHLPLSADDKAQLVDRFISVARATLKGTFFVGVIQGALGGMAFWVAGIDGALFWGALMAVASMIPALGPPLIWVPAIIVLAVQGAVVKAIVLGIFCALVVGAVDNVLRPRLVGHDTQMHDLMILLSTLGGILLFGVAGVVIGPIIAALFVSVWGMFGVAYRDLFHAADEEPEP